MRGLDDTSPRSLREAQWLALPKWARIYSLVVGIPAFLWLALHPGPDLVTAIGGQMALGLFVSVVALQMALLFRAYWRMDI